MLARNFGRVGRLLDEYGPRLVDTDVFGEQRVRVAFTITLRRVEHLRRCVLELNQPLDWGAPRDLDDSGKPGRAISLRAPSGVHEVERQRKRVREERIVERHP